MLGWRIVVKREGTEVGDILATWEASLGGIDWLMALVAMGRAVQIRRSGYPSLFFAKAADVLPLIMDGPPRHEDPLILGDDYISLGGWAKQFKLNKAQADACSLGERLSIEAWDQS